MMLAAGTRLGSYEILDSIGAGGMGVVYRARDSRLDRDVAIKVLPASVAADPEALARFEREAKAVAALSHPNILSIFDFGTEDGRAYAVMELLEGETLRGALAAGRLPPKQALDYAVQIADGLSAAHERGIVHRDLKPENVFVLRDGRVKILDFGLAKRVEVDSGRATSAPTAVNQTEPGTVMGTLGYMSPEQLRGLAVDHRTDVFAFGAILYELLAGRKAFQRETASDTISAVLRDEPPELADSEGNSPAVAAIVRHCLEKDRDRRFQSVRDIAFSLRELQAAPSGSSRSATMAAWPETPKLERRRPAARAIAAAVAAALLLGAAVYLARRSSGPSGPADLSIAVLPFVNMSADRNQEFFADGISEELLNLLTRVPQLRVIARTSSFSFKGKEVDVATIAKTLNVGFVLEGSVRESGSKMRVTAQLIRAADSSQMWSETYDRPIDDVLRVQDEIAAAVVGQLKLKLLGGTQPPKTVDPRAHALVVQARQLGRLGTKEGYDQSLALLREALGMQPDYALAWDNVAFYYMIQQYRGWMPQPEAFRLAREAVGKALAADPDLARAHARLGEIALDEGDLATAAKHVQHALTLAPTDDVALNIASTLLALLGRSREAAAVGEYLVSKDPVNPIVLVNQSETLSETGRYGEAAVLARTALGLTPGRASAQAALATALLLDGKPQEALAASADMKDEVTRLAFQAMACHAMGKRREADVAFRELMGKAGPDELWIVAQVAAFLGEPDQAFAFAEKASQIPGAVANASQDPLFGQLHDDPRWLPFLRQHGLEPEKLAAIAFQVTLPREPS